jgi:acyl-CoA synthetase (AMP-forming)/AMP-acid ligase II
MDTQNMNQPVSRKDSSNVKQFLLPHLQQFIAEKTGKSLEEVTPNKVEQYLPILLNKIELLLLQEPSINDCAVLLRETQTSEAELVAYIVSTSAFSPEHLASHLQNSFPVALHPKTYIPVAQLPLTPEGEVDKLALSDLPVLDSSLIQKWENQLNLQPEIDQVAVVFEEYVQPNPPLHLADLLPQWKATHSEIVVTSPPETETPPVEQQTESLKTLAISHGKRLELPNELKNLADILKKSVTEACHQGIIYLNSYGEESFQSYPDLLAESEKIMSGLRKIGLNPQDKVIFQLDTNSDIIPGFLACILGGFVPVPISAITTSDPTNNTVKKLLNAWKMLEHPLILTNKNLASQLNNISKSLNLEGFKVAEIESLRDGDRDQNWHPSQPDDLAVLLLTSGSTGIPKGVMLTHRNIVSSVVGTSQMSGFDQQEISLNWLPLDHPGPLIRCVIRIIYLGSQQIHAPTAMVLQEPLKWLDWIEHYHVTTTWAPNFAFALVNDRAEEIVNKKWDLSSVKSLLNTAEPIVPQTDQRFLELLQPHGLSANVMYSSWGMAETSSGVTLSNEYLLDSSQNIEASFVELGSPIAGVSLRIVNQNHEIVEEKTIGYLQVKGATLTQGYYQNSEANEEAFSEDGWFNTGDLGFLDRGRLTITGRTKDVIIVNGNNCYSHEIESAVEEVEGVEVSYTAACGIRQPGSNTDQLLIFFHTAIIENEGLLKLIKEIQKSVVRKIGISPAYLIPVSQETIPKTSIGKIKRSQLKQQFEAGDFDEIVKKIDILLGNQNTLPNWFYRPIWRSKQALILNPIPRKGLTLIFLDELGLGELLYTQLSENQPTVAVEIGSEFVQLSKNRYCIDPKNPQHYQKLLESITTENLAIQQILHLWTYGNYPGETFSLEAVEQAQKYGVYSLLFLVQALEKVQVSQASVRIQIVSSHSQAVSASDQVACERSPIY